MIDAAPDTLQRSASSAARRERAGARLVLAWHVFVAATLVIVPASIMLGRPPWDIDVGRLHGLLGVPLAYLCSGVLLSLAWRRPAPIGALRSFGTLAAGLAVFFLVLLLSRDAWYSRVLLLSGSGLAAACIVAPVLLSRLALKVAAALLAVFAVGSVAAAPTPPAEVEAPRVPTVTSQVLATSHGTVTAVEYWWYTDPVAAGGGIDVLGDAYVVSTGDGDLYRVEWVNASDSLRVTELPHQIPLNRDEFVTDVGEAVSPTLFRVADSLLRVVGDSVHIVASHHYWHADEQCFVVRISSLVLAFEELDRGVASDRWRVLYDTRPCLAILSHERGWPFTGIQMGGRLADLGDERILVTIGDHGFDGWYSDHALPQDPSADYGKTLVIDRDGHAERLTMGHRNPQGLHIDAAGHIWLTEHGPQGGDMLHEIVPGANYGWPYRTYGTDYGDVVWPLQGRGDWDDSSFRPAVFAWVPSIGVSNLIEVRRGPLTEWQGDLMIGSLPARSLYRVRREAGRVVYVEPIHIGLRIRDLVEGPDGRIVLWTDMGGITSLSANVPARGEALFPRCIGCHTTEPGGASALGPSLHGIYGRSIGADAHFAYSPALRNVSGRWSAKSLDAFLADPQAFVPGTIMAADPISDPDERASLIEYLKTVR